jgi:phage replication O-like protein O
MATSPQVERGFTCIANEIIEALAKTNFSGYQGRCVYLLLRKTYGFRKKADVIALSQWAEGTGLQVSHISRTLKELRQRNIITKIGNKWAFNKNYTRWGDLPKLVKGGKVTIPESRVTKNGKPELPAQGRHSKWPRLQYL